MIAILNSSFWLTYVGLELYELLNLHKDTDALDAHLFNDMFLFGNILIVFLASILLMFANLMQRLKLYWIYLIVSCLILLPLGPTYSFVPFPAHFLSIQTLIFIASTLFHFISLVVVWMAAREEQPNKGDMEKGQILSSDQLKPEKDPSTLKF